MTGLKLLVTFLGRWFDAIDLQIRAHWGENKFLQFMFNSKQVNTATAAMISAVTTKTTHIQ